MEYTKNQLIAIISLRVLIGWHFLHEGVSKLVNPDWTSKPYLESSHGLFAGFFRALASNENILEIVDFLNIGGLLLIGVGLILGIVTRIAIVSGIALLAMYWLSHIGFQEAKYSLPIEGNYLLIDKNLIELVSLVVLLLFPSGHIIGIDRLLFRKR